MQSIPIAIGANWMQELPKSLCPQVIERVNRLSEWQLSILTANDGSWSGVVRRGQYCNMPMKAGQLHAAMSEVCSCDYTRTSLVIGSYPTEQAEYCSLLPKENSR